MTTEPKTNEPTTTEPKIVEPRKNWRPEKSWKSKFANAFAGIFSGIKGQNSFLVHIPVATIVIVAGFYLRLSSIEFCILLLCIAAVLTAELFNSSIEYLAKAISREYDENLRNGLNIASGAVLMTTIFAIVIGLIILGPPIQNLLGF